MRTSTPARSRAGISDEQDEEEKKNLIRGVGNITLMDDTDVCSKLLLHLYTSRVLKDDKISRVDFITAQY